MGIYLDLWYTQSLLHSNKEVGLAVNTEKTKYMLMSRHQNAGENNDMMIPNRSFENVAKFPIFGNDSNK
jgi:hypothetical protein